jgi:haloalkane dehalogenase
MSSILRTPEERFAALPDFVFEPHYRDDLPGYEGLRMHYADAGPRDAAVTFLCLHGQPTWAYLFRRMFPLFTAPGHRAVAPDLFGFGRSDKPADEARYSFESHRASLLVFIETLDLRNICLVVQDWGGLLGLTLPMAMPERISRLLIMNTTLAGGDEALPAGFIAWANNNPDMAVGKLLGRACPHLSAAECAAYDAPYPDASFKAGVRRFPNLVPDRVDAPGAALSREARVWLAQRWRGESFMAIGMKDPVLGPDTMRALHRHIRGCPPPLELADAGHFVQEWGAPIAAAALTHFQLGQAL